MKNHTYQNIKLVKNFYATAACGDTGPGRYLLDPNMEWIEPKVPGLWFSGTHRGADAVWKEVFGPAPEKVENFKVTMKKFYALGDHVIAIGYIHGRNKMTGKTLDAAAAHVWTLREGKAVRLEAFHDTASWLETMGLAQAEPQRIAA
jgi:hypothetical protein